MNIHTPPTCARCVSYDHNECTCREQSSEMYQHNLSPFHVACPKYLSVSYVYGKVPKRKKWHKVKTMDDIETPGARFY